MSFVFAPTASDSRRPTAARKIHIRRLYDVMHVCIQRNDLQRATKAWSILARCKEVNWRTMWSTSVHILAENLDESEKAPHKIEFLRVMMLQHPDDREAILKELVLRLILSGQNREALDELELYLPSFPYQDDPLLHTYAGLIAIYTAQPLSGVASFNPIFLRNAQAHFERAKSLDPDNEIADAFLWKVRKLHSLTVAW
ncbi:hypothetical protein DFH07DRAFT_760592 [Mycena maculata]|uniref:Uncharacterized protein n=1 Tax=Mycena maculata TaxID=230809 RepID=A0AAD7MKD9_9AGAR|nr:hypothetical protein DFH07DRAFT_760592 [Mycena maculata]